MTKKHSSPHKTALPSTDLKVEYHLLTSLKPSSCNPRTHSKKQIRQIADSIQEFGFTQPILIDEDKNVLAGHGRLEAAKLIGLKRVPTVSRENMTRTQKRAYRIADNKLAENAGWDIELLSIEFQILNELDPDFDLTHTGFEVAETDIFIDGPGDSNSDDELDHFLKLIIRLHRLLAQGTCGNSKNIVCFAATPPNRNPTGASWATVKHRWCLPTPRTMSPSTDM